METLIFLISCLLGSLDQVESKSDDCTGTKSSGAKGHIVGGPFAGRGCLGGLTALAAQEGKFFDGLLFPLLQIDPVVNGLLLLRHVSRCTMLLEKSLTLLPAVLFVLFPANGILRGNVLILRIAFERRITNPVAHGQILLTIDKRVFSVQESIFELITGLFHDMRHHSTEDELIDSVFIPGHFIDLLDSFSLLLHQRVKEVIQTLVSLITLFSQVLRHLLQGAIHGLLDLLSDLLSKLSLLLLVPLFHLVHGITRLLHPLIDRLLIDVSIPDFFKPVFDLIADRFAVRAILTFPLLVRSLFIIYWINRSRVTFSFSIFLIELLDH